MSLALAVEPIPLHEVEGTVRLRGTRVSLDSIVHRHRQGLSPQEIHEAFPSVPLADVYAAISYYLRHQDEVDEYLERRTAEADQIRDAVEARPATRALRRKLRAARPDIG